MFPFIGELLRSRGFSLILSLLALLGSAAGLLIFNGNILGVSPNSVSELVTPETTTSANISERSDFQVYLSGAVKNPGVYSLNKNARLIDAVKVAGGFTTYANTIYISKTLNLSKKLSDEMHLYIPSISEETLTVDIPDYATEAGSPASNTSSDTPSASSSLLNINKASKEELMNLKGVGEAYATRIINNRPYQSMSDLQNKAKLPPSLVKSLESDATVN